ncbi:MAG TPA: DNA-3-methyladenine glycosylase I [Myxococcota bacterium]|nr:DNA-3-methyladenine glycosylase I [Myxococcota bacterium]
MRVRDKRRCAWVADDPLRIAYHDREWGVPAYDDRVLFEFLLLEGAQAGLSWDTILRKRDGYRRAYHRFNPRRVAKYDAQDRARLLADPGIVRNRSKVAASIQNAQVFLEVQREFGSFDRYLWGFVGDQPIQGKRCTAKEVPARTPESDALSKDLRRRGFKFVGSTICYAFMQAVGVVNDHTQDCFRAREVRSLGQATPGKRAR